MNHEGYEEVGGDDAGSDQNHIESLIRSAFERNRFDPDSIPPDGEMPVPDDELFDGMTYRDADDLAMLGYRLMIDDPATSWIQRHKIEFLWKRNGGKNRGALTLTGLRSVSGILAHYCDADAIIWLGADHVRTLHLTVQQTKAALYHELLHFDVTDKDSLSTRPHDAEYFAAELKRFGLWHPDSSRMEEAIKQLPLFNNA